ncbi:response regulator [Leekyejoonella antrihumi]|uniref:Response regulator transcription factor n=1 Tax=Leekyejoonella antrihumi TaxID=1660198 RepID=A0A563E082_9MICO|nr:response regulator transcription factor [Leekyejoonella antrihumi]TWP35950.1 response regulator transcription factor [Leekyejoonella antrihumi]
MNEHQPALKADDRTADWSPPLRVVVVDDNEIIRVGLRSMLETDPTIRVVGEAGDGRTAVAVVKRETPDVALVDVRMPVADGVSVASEVHDLTKVLMLTYSDSPDIVRSALAAGARGYLVHGAFTPQELTAAIRSVAQGGSVLSSQAIEAVQSALTAAPAVPDPSRHDIHGLSRREREIMDLIAQGHTNGEISGGLFLAEKTVKNHVNHIFAKLGVTSRSAAVALWLG